jgi:hypothetical protein
LASKDVFLEVAHRRYRINQRPPGVLHLKPKIIPYLENMMPEDREGTGKHAHKSTEEPYPHTKDRGTEHGEKQESRHSGGESQSSNRERSESGSRSESSDLKEREYRDNEGDVHHHTRTFQEQHGKEEK